MLKISNSKNLSLLFAAIVIQLFSCNAVAAESNVSTSDIVKEIEKTLLFDKESREKIDVYKKDKSLKKSDYNITAGIAEPDKKIKGKKDNQEIEIVIIDAKSENFDLREKEKLAYNSVLIGQFEVAIEIYKQVLMVEPNNQYSKFSLAVVYQKLGQNRQAKILYRDLLKAEATNQEEIVGNLLSILIEESPKDAAYLLSRLTAQSPKSAYVLAQAAIVYDKINNYSNAAILLQRAIDLDPTNVSYKYNLAIIYDKMARDDEAVSLYAEVVESYNDEDQSISIDKVQKRIQAIKSKI